MPANLSLLLGLLLSCNVFAFPCVATIAKQNCWLDYDLNILVLDANTQQQLAAVHIPKGKLWERAQFSCQPNQTLAYKASFTPNIWQGEENKSYDVIRFWTLPAAPKKDDLAWEISICFAENFAEVPMPPQAVGVCVCDFKNIPPITSTSQQ